MHDITKYKILATAKYFCSPVITVKLLYFYPPWESHITPCLPLDMLGRNLGRYQEHCLQHLLKAKNAPNRQHLLLFWKIFTCLSSIEKLPQSTERCVFNRGEERLGQRWWGWLNGLSDRTEFGSAYASRGERWRTTVKGYLSSLLPGSKASPSSALNRMRKSLNINKSSLGPLLQHAPCY